MLTEAERSRYQRQLALPEIGIEGQQRLRDARVLVVGAGGLGSPAALYLAAAGVGSLGLVDSDVVELNNLHRQILHGTADVGRPKADSGRDALRRLNPTVRVEARQERLSRAGAEALFAEYDVIVDGSDNFATRYAVNDACARLRKPWVYGSVERFSGQVAVFGAQDGPCYRCLFPEAPTPGSTASCEEIGVLGAVPGVIGSLQAVEALKLILGVGQPLVGRILQLDLQNAKVAIVEFPRRPDCEACGADASGQEVASESATSLDEAELPLDIEPAELAARLTGADSPTLLDIREPWEVQLAKIGKSQHLPMRDLPNAIGSLDRDRELVLYCHHGSRSSMAAEWLRGNGYRARSLAGGIDRWSREIDPSVRRY